MFKFIMVGLLGIQGFFGLLLAEDSESVKKEIRERLQKFSEAVDQGNVDSLSSFWTEDAELVKPLTGEVVEGKEKINQLLQKNSRELKDRQLKFNFKADKIDLVDVDDAVVQGVVEITGKGGLLQRTARRIELVKENGQWYIDDVQEIEVAPAPSSYAHLKEIEWLVGNWEDTGNDVTITFETKWDKNKNFITQDFKMSVYGLEALEGFQIIGWDPIEKKIRSWIYDSDGGFGTGYWVRKDDSWQVSINYVLSDGKKGSATDIYTKIDDKSYTYASIDRKIDNQTIPDIEPVTIVKEK